MSPVPNSEVYNLFSVRSRTPKISEGMWARIKGGNYKGYLAHVLHDCTSNFLCVLFFYTTCETLIPFIYYYVFPSCVCEQYLEKSYSEAYSEN